MDNPLRDQYDDLYMDIHCIGDFKMGYLHYHDSYEIYALEKGERLYLVEDRFVHLRPRDVILIKPETIHCTLGGEFVRSLLLFRKEYLNNFFSEQGIELVTKCFDKNVIRVRESDFSEFICLMERLSADGNDIMTFTRLLSILQNNMSRRTVDLQSTKPKVADIVDYIIDNYKNIDNLDTISDNFYISKEYLCRLFKEHTGTSIIKYINILKVHASIELLADKDLTMAEVAERSGFNTVSNFCRAFKNFTGMSPLKYSKNGGNDKIQSNQGE